jgi:hypothetical protein
MGFYIIISVIFIPFYLGFWTLTKLEAGTTQWVALAAMIPTVLFSWWLEVKHNK